MASKPRKGRVQKKGTFTCENCKLSTPFHAFGRSCPFSSSLVVLEEAYITRDPFSPTPNPLILGSHCVSCNRTVCVAASCSVFYTKRFCIDCAKSNLGEFPPQVQQEILKESK